MYYLFSLLAGLLISVMVVCNGGLTGRYGVYTSGVIIHATGFALISFLTFLRRERPFSKRYAWFLYSGGVIGVFTIVFNNLAFGRISLSAILALSLLGQTVTGLVIDQLGFCGKYPFSKKKLAGLFLILCGIVSMTDNFDPLAVAVSFASGITVVVSRTLNAKLADLTSVRVSTFYNYLTGLTAAVFMFWIFGGTEQGFMQALSPDIYIYFGGALGLCVVLISNLTVMKISAFYLTLLMFAGQVFSGVLIDMLISGEASVRILTGGILVTAGLCVNLIIDNKKDKADNTP